MLTGKRILVTSGGTQEYIDDVRVMTNISSGQLGADIAVSLIDAGTDIYYLKGANAAYPDPMRNGFYHTITVKSAQDAYNEMEKLVPAMDAVIHCMAVSDFTFKRDVALKCKSSDPQAFIDYMARTITKNPKIISKVKEWNPKTLLVGFKFEVGIDHEELIKLARNSIDNNGCNLVVANDKEEMVRDKAHTAYLVRPDGSSFKVSGKKEIAEQILVFLNNTLGSRSARIALNLNRSAAAAMNKLIPPLDPMPLIPVGSDHPGAFGVNRHLHVHTGVDLYAPHGSPVKAMEAGKVISIAWFTGPAINMPWWNDTRAVYIDGETGVFNYGEIQEFPTLKVGDYVKQGQIIGSVMTVLKKFKGRPMSMLHLELYDHGYTDTWGEWKIGEPKPEHLQDPTPYFWVMDETKGLLFAIQKDQYAESAQYFKENQRNCHNCERVAITDICTECRANNLNRWV